MDKYEEMAIKNLGVSEFNARKSIGDFTELLNSIEEVGVLEPLIVRPKGKRFEVVIGRRRLTAAKAAGLKRVPVIVGEMSDTDAVIASTTENIQRNNLEPDEEYDAYKLLEKFGFDSHRRIAKSIGKSPGYVDQVYTSVEVTRGLKVPTRRHPSKAEREAGEAVPIKHATMVGQAFKHEDVKPTIEKWPKAKVKQKKEELIKTVAPLDEFEARKVVNHFKMEPERPIEETKVEALAKETGVHIYIYLSPKVGRALKEAAKERHRTMKKLIPIAVEEWLKQVGYL